MTGLLAITSILLAWLGAGLISTVFGVPVYEAVSTTMSILIGSIIGYYRHI